MVYGFSSSQSSAEEHAGSEVVVVVVVVAVVAVKVVSVCSATKAEDSVRPRKAEESTRITNQESTKSRNFGLLLKARSILIVQFFCVFMEREKE
jgi:hypothetical protein